MWFFIYVNRGPVQVKISKSMWFTRLLQNIKETTKEFLLSLDLLFDMAHDQATSLISHRPNSCQTKSMIAQDLKFLEDQLSGRKMELGSLDKKYYMKVTRKGRQREELHRNERERCKLIKTHALNGAAACLMTMMATLKTLDCTTLNLRIQI